MQFGSSKDYSCNGGLRIESAPTSLAAGTFFGDRVRTVTTPSFQFCDLSASLPEREVPRHKHEAPHFILIMTGTYVTEARNQDGLCSSGTLIFNPGGTTHRDCFRSARGRFLSISPGPDSSRLLERGSPTPLVITAGTRLALEAALIGDRILQEFSRSKPSSLAAETLGLELVGLLSGIEPRSAAFPSWLQTAREMIEDCFDRDLTISELAASVDVHPVYLARAYRRHFRCSPGEYLRRCRLLRVRGLLIQTDLPLVDVALQSGFSDQSQMTRSFSERFGVSPGRYRRVWRRSSLGSA